jgi:hypothetical protein
MKYKDKMRELTAFVGLCFGLLEDKHWSDERERLDLKEIANVTGLSLATLYRLIHEDYTPAVHAGTLQTLARAAGLPSALLNHETVDDSTAFKSTSKRRAKAMPSR